MGQLLKVTTELPGLKFLLTSKKLTYKKSQQVLVSLKSYFIVILGFKANVSLFWSLWRVRPNEGQEKV